ncbi:hypothetical protein KQI74_22655 [Paenibacillus barcinonensis]|uniref:hypothetical protein n=1 Tax=Paenibacillus barcinonensis TaxID=198119 RepID=UPI001C11051C|nr:hypothetical protein [Paenibacillus barcinonensis]MBU5355089.1 hypothetical protein [Paenibacillus barcinonensis]
MKIINNLQQTPERAESLFHDLLKASQFEKVNKQAKVDLLGAQPIEKVAYQMTLVYEDNPSVELEILFVKYNEKTVLSFERVINGSSNRSLVVTGYFVEGSTLQQVEAKANNELLVTETPAVDDVFSFMNLIPDNSEVKVQDLFDGCLVFRDDYNKSHVYKHCGKACGDGSPTGGGTPINTLDYCCRAHDRCYSNFGFDDCGCDAELERCARTATDSPGWRSVYMWSGSKSCK